MVHPVSANPPLSSVKRCSVKTFGFLILPNFTTIGLASAVETLRMANLAAHQTLFRSVLIAADEAPVVASNGMRVLPDYSIANAPALDTLLVVGANPIDRGRGNRPLIEWLRHLARQHLPLGGICTGSYLLAKAELLTGYRCTIHWEDLPTLQAHFPGIVISSSCSSWTATVIPARAGWRRWT